MEIPNFQLQENSYLRFNVRFKILHSNWRERRFVTKVLAPRKVSWEEDISEAASVTGVFVQNFNSDYNRGRNCPTYFGRSGSEKPFRPS